MKKVSIIVLMFFFVGAGSANNIRITNISVVPANKTIKFDITWENSWRSDMLNNWDAAYVFFKVFEPMNGRYLHVFCLDESNNKVPAGFTATRHSYNNGYLLYRSAAGSGTTTMTNIELGIEPEWTTGVFDIKAFAIEMVYVPTGNFYVGDPTSTNSYSLRAIGSGTTVLNDPLGTPSSTLSFTGFPNGHAAFYCMKYELSQGGYRDFLNTLTYRQQANHMAVAPNSIISTWILNSANRNNLKIRTPGTNATIPAVIGCDTDGDLIFDEPNDGENIACNFLSWVDMAAYLVWAGLRPLTELEYEKAARGIQIPVPGEYAWGNANIHNSAYTLANANQNSETVSNPATGTTGNANCAPTYPSLAIGPMRNGIFATATSNRITSGGSFYGVMEMSGNLWEQVITTANVQGRGFTDGPLSLGLNEDGYPWNGVTTWPGGSTGVVNGSTNALGLTYRGGSWGTPISNLRISDRSGGLVNNPGLIRNPNYGIRGCLTAP